MDTLGPGILSFIERLSSLQRLKCTSIIGKWNFWDLKVRGFSIVSFIRSVLYLRFHCTALKSSILHSSSADAASLPSHPLVKSCLLQSANRSHWWLSADVI